MSAMKTFGRTFTCASLCAVTLALGGCVRAHHPGIGPGDRDAPAHRLETPEYRQRVDALTRDLIALDARSDGNEAELVAATAICYAALLAREYRIVRPAILHNVLVRLRLKERGLCYHWTEDLLTRLEDLKLRSFQLHWGVAHRGSELREHNSVVITAHGQAFAQGLVLDPWRQSGHLYWAPVGADRYPWQPLPAVAR
ncbi:MAG: hypothetical protein JSW39_01045 [Desulfobacterales bacterium]|nr:MAG: hypothetical protein JSW39_01045 [Desulfobacterales bacterium]